MSNEHEQEGPLARLMRGLGIDDKLAPIAAVKRIEEEPVKVGVPRAFDLSYEYHSSAPPDRRWSVIDLNTYDGAPDSEGCSRFMGWGKNHVDALRDLREQFDDYDEKPPPRMGRLVDGGGGVQPPEYVDDYRDPDDVDFDSDLEDQP